MTREEWLKEMEDQYGKSTLEDMINVRVVEQLAKKNKLKISKSEVDREFLLIKAVNNSFYEDEHTTEKEWKDQIRYNILLEDLLTRDIDISNKELESFYNKNKELYQFDDSYRIRHIVVKDEEEAREVLKELMIQRPPVQKDDRPSMSDILYKQCHMLLGFDVMPHSAFLLFPLAFSACKRLDV